MGDATDRNDLQHLDDRQLLAVDMLASGMSGRSVVEELGIDRTTLWRWRREAPFMAALAGRREELWQASKDKLRSLLPRAMDLIEEAIDGGDVRSALAIVKIAGFSDLGDVGPSDLETIADAEQSRRAARERLRQTEAREQAEAEVRQLEHERALELRRLYVG